MNAIKQFNAFAVGLPFAIAFTYPLFKEGALMLALLSTMLTGFIQVVLALCMLYDEPNDRKLQGYIAATIIFFTLWYINAQIEYYNPLTLTLFGIPAALAFYLTYIIHQKAKL
ncbi:hypothetical protein [Flavobacterium sp.]|uniref:hypothetical protein n=1 Tax=Flavobacterium sp. TaxID=239 RepID=UPI0025DF71D0|nr:hypothetical protein [Flavobacterium sp.]